MEEYRKGREEKESKGLLHLCDIQGNPQCSHVHQHCPFLYKSTFFKTKIQSIQLKSIEYTMSYHTCVNDYIHLGDSLEDA